MPLEGIIEASYTQVSIAIEIVFNSRISHSRIQKTLTAHDVR